MPLFAISYIDIGTGFDPSTAGSTWNGQAQTLRVNDIQDSLFEIQNNTEATALNDPFPGNVGGYEPGEFVTYFSAYDLTFQNGDAATVVAMSNFSGSGIQGTALVSGKIPIGSPIALSVPTGTPTSFFYSSLQTIEVNDAPTALALSGGLVFEGSGTGTVVAALDTTDPDSSGSHTYTLLDNAGGRFALVGNALVVVNGVLLDFEQAKNHSVTVRSTDQDGASKDQAFTIAVGDVRSEVVTGTDANDTIVGGAGPDWFAGIAGADSLFGGGGRDSLLGGSGNDRLRGGSSIDELSGGAGRDRFIFDDRETGSSERTADHILDFSGRRGDKIDISLVDANGSATGDGKFTFLGEENAFTGVGQVRYEQVGGETFVYLNTDADASAEAVIRLRGGIDLTSAYFVL